MLSQTIVFIRSTAFWRAWTILSGVAAPEVTRYVEDAKLVRARGADGIVESAFERHGLPTTGDDITSMVSSGRMGR